MKIVFDLDDTISRHTNREFAEAAPIMETIQKMQQLKLDGWGIEIYSARGQNSCKGDFEKIEKKYRKQVEEWLAKYEVPYDKLTFGKPLADLYVDDKGISLNEFLQSDFCELSGNSGAKVYRAGKCIIKKCKDPQAQADWYRLAMQYGVNVPEVYSVVLDSIYIEYIEGLTGDKRELEFKDIFTIISHIMFFSLIKRNDYKFNMDELYKKITSHLETYGKETDFSKLLKYFETNRAWYESQSSFCHGDLSLSNTIYDGNKLYLIDPIKNENLSSYLMDFAKIRFSLNGGEQYLHNTIHTEYENILNEFSKLLQDRGDLKNVIALESTYWIRLIKYTNDPIKRDFVVNKAKELEAQL